MARTSFVAALVVLILSLLNFYIYYIFLSQLYFLSAYKIFFISLCATIILLEAAYFVLLRDAKISSNTVIFLASLVGITFILFSVTVLYQITIVALSFMPISDDMYHISKKTIDIIFTIIAVCYIVFGFVYGGAKAQITHKDIEIENLKKPLNIIHLSDLHVGKIIKEKFVADVAKKTNALNPDIVVITGDLVDIEALQVMEFLLPFKNLKTKFGVYYVLGNHEYFHGAHEIVKFIKTLNISVLQNESVIIDNNINLIGLNDLFGNFAGYLKPDMEKAYKDIDKNLPNILLAHQPKQAKFIDDKYRVDLMLSGHTHGGQIFPFNFFVLLDQPFVKGFHIYKNKIPIFISKGTGCWGPPIRFLAASEIVKLNLVKKHVNF